MVTHLKETFQNQGKGKGKGKRKGDAVVGGTKPTAEPNPLPTKKARPPKDAICLLRNFKLYLKDQINKRRDEISTSGIFVIDVHLSTITAWVLDTACGFQDRKSVV